MFPNVKLVSVVYLFVVVISFLHIVVVNYLKIRTTWKKRDVAPICRIYGRILA